LIAAVPPLEHHTRPLHDALPISVTRLIEHFRHAFEPRHPFVRRRRHSNPALGAQTAFQVGPQPRPFAEGEQLLAPAARHSFTNPEVESIEIVTQSPDGMRAQRLECLFEVPPMQRAFHQPGEEYRGWMSFERLIEIESR